MIVREEQSLVTLLLPQIKMLLEKRLPLRQVTNYKTNTSVEPPNKSLGKDYGCGQHIITLLEKIGKVKGGNREIQRESKGIKIFKHPQLNKKNFQNNPEKSIFSPLFKTS